MSFISKSQSSRTALFQIFRDAVKIFNSIKNEEASSVIEAQEKILFPNLSRRDFLKSVASVSLGIGATQFISSCSTLLPDHPNLKDKKIVIIGAGMAGLNCALQLEKLGYSSTIYEASKRSGGRMYTAQNLMGEGLTTEIGGEFIDSSHLDILNLVKEFNLDLIDTNQDPLPSSFFFGGQHRSLQEAIEAFIPLAERIKRDIDKLSEIINYQNRDQNTIKFDQMSIEEYLDYIGANGWIRNLLEVAYVTEYGLEISEQSALNLILLIGTESKEEFKLFGNSDERYKIRGGNDLLVKKMAEYISAPIFLEHKLEAIRNTGMNYKLHFRVANSKSIEISADLLILTLPFSMLRDVEINTLNFSPLKLKAINELCYGANAKLFASYSKKVWRDLNFNGNVQSDQAYQLIWDNSQMQDRDYGGLTFYSGGKAGILVGENSAEAQIKKLLSGVEQTFPNSSDYLSGVYQRFHWPSHNFTKGSYAVYKPGQWTSISGAEILPQGRIFFAGEHCSSDFQGFMNGAAETGRIAAQSIAKLFY